MLCLWFHYGYSSAVRSLPVVAICKMRFATSLHSFIKTHKYFEIFWMKSAEYSNYKPHEVTVCGSVPVCAHLPPWVTTRVCYVHWLRRNRVLDFSSLSSWKELILGKLLPFSTEELPCAGRMGWEWIAGHSGQVEFIRLSMQGFHVQAAKSSQSVHCKNKMKTRQFKLTFFARIVVS